MDVTELVTACGAALSSLTVAEDMINAVYRICDFHQQPANRGMCAAAGVIPLVVTALSTHGVVRAGVAARGCEVLGRLASSSRANADAVVVSEGGMRVICTVMATHADDEDVQRQGCWAVWVIARYVSPAAMLVVRDSRAVELIVAAMKRSPREGNGTVKYWGSFALAKLTA